MTHHSSSEESARTLASSGMIEVGAWRLLELRSWGANGLVYRAEPLNLAGAGPFAFKLAIQPMDQRFLREAELLRRVVHPHVPRLHDQGLWAHPAGPFPYLVMDWFEGLSLYAWARERRRSKRELMRVLASVTRAVAATHAVDAVHRDIKGENILVRREDSRPLLIDFGAGDFLGARTLTLEGLPPGTPAYRSPEALRFQCGPFQQQGGRYEPGPADDVYALGVTAWRLCTGTYPPPLPPPEALEQEPSFEELVAACPELAGIIRQMLSEEPSARGTAEQIAEALERAARVSGPEADQPITRRPIVAPVTRKRASRPPSPARTWRPWFAAAAGVASVLVLQERWARQQHPLETAPVKLARAEQANGGTALAQELVVSVRTEMPEPTREGLGVEFPQTPLPGQARPPCKSNEVEIHGGCWKRPRTSTPPCEERDYEWRGGCYYPVILPTPPATSEPHSE